VLEGTQCCRVLQIVAECCRVLQSVAECCRVLQSVAECCRVLQSVAEWHTLLCRVFISQDHGVYLADPAKESVNGYG